MQAIEVTDFAARHEICAVIHIIGYLIQNSVSSPGVHATETFNLFGNLVVQESSQYIEKLDGRFVIDILQHLLHRAELD